MDSNQHFWLRFWAIVFSFLIVLVVSCTVAGTIAGHDRRAKIAEAIKAGASPGAAYCAISFPSEGERVMCTIAFGGMK